MKRIPLSRISTLTIIAFLTGFALMAYELVAARLLAPTLGSSIYVWTSVIGVIIAALSVGYWLGGKLADARQNPIDVVWMCLIAAGGALLTIGIHVAALDWISESIVDVRLQGVVASLFLFAPTSFVIGSISPYLAKLNIKSLETAGESVANLSALNSIGGIVGTFVTGFILFGMIGSNETLIVVIVFLIASSWLLVPRKKIITRSIISILIIGLSFIPTPLMDGQLARIDTPSAHYEVLEFNYRERPVNGLATGPGGIQSGVYTSGPNDLVFWYTRFAAQQIEAAQPKNILILGGGAFTLSQKLAKTLPVATIDTVEIDPALEDIAKDYFRYESTPNVSLIFQDARAFVNTTDKKYDAIFVDVFSDSSTPFSLLTQEYGTQIQRILSDDGIVLVNAIGGLKGVCEPLISAIDSTYRSFLPYGYWATESNQSVSRGNYILLYSPTPRTPQSMNKLAEPAESVRYSDNFMPAEKLHYQCEQAV